MSDEALLLGIDTSGAEGSLALARVDAEVHLLSQSLLTGRRYAAQLVPRLRAMIAESSRVLADLSAIVIVNGPGSFTGLRVGISATKALAEAASLPVISLSRLAVLCSLVGKDTVVVLDAGRGEYYLRLSSASGEPIESLESLPTLIEKAREVKLCICEPQLAGPLADLQPVLVPPPTALGQAIF
jgi:tRNA threonylcarbamoyladenosine biosynthesis protein TsaB